MAPVLVSEGFLIGPPECLPLSLHGLLWELPNRQGTQGGGLTLLILLVINPIWDILKRGLKEKCFSLW